ncbi:MAG: putative 2-aminoethylphosphonate ABC transporter ATP-binding protein [Thermodesulfobacteriota bacterium]
MTKRRLPPFDCSLARAWKEPVDLYLEAENITKTFGRFPALKDVSFQAGRGEFICLLGPSGCGKTTMLRIVAGLEKQDGGRIIIEHKDISHLPSSKRNVGLVFQSYALFPNLTVMENVAYGLKRWGHDRAMVRHRVNELLDLMELKAHGGKYPAQLSGGQQQRVALARALALSPRLLLLDEPLSALDAQVRVMLRTELKQIQRRLNVTTVMVTHDQEEALTMADRILVMDQGVLIQSGTPLEVYERPATPFVASFIGAMNFLPRSWKSDGRVFRLGAASLRVDNGIERQPDGRQAVLAIRPEDIEFEFSPGEEVNVFQAGIKALEYRGSYYRLDLSLYFDREESAGRLSADLPADKVGRLDLRPGAARTIRLPSDRLKVFPV